MQKKETGVPAKMLNTQPPTTPAWFIAQDATISHSFHRDDIAPPQSPSPPPPLPPAPGKLLTF